MFDEVKKLRQQGKTPVIKLTPGLLLPKPKKSICGRPRKYPPGTSLQERYKGRRGKGRPRCMAYRCNRDLRMQQEAACSKVCESRIINDAIHRLKKCGITKETLLKLYGD